MHTSALAKLCDGVKSEKDDESRPGFMIRRDFEYIGGLAMYGFSHWEKGRILFLPDIISRL